MKNLSNDLGEKFSYIKIRQSGTNLYSDKKESGRQIKEMCDILQNESLGWGDDKGTQFHGPGSFGGGGQSNEMRPPQIIFKETHAILLPHPHVKS